jgi:hypothetical protein
VPGRLAALTLLPLAGRAAAGGFARRDGDTVAFPGGSSAAARAGGTLAEDDMLPRSLGRKARFHNAGRGGGTAVGPLPATTFHITPRPAIAPGVCFCSRR